MTAVDVDEDEPAPAARPFFVAAVGRLGLPEVVVAALVVTWSVVFIRLAQLRHDRFATFGFDLGIYDQGIWLLSRFHDPFVTLRGLELFGHHANLILVFLVPFYWLGAGPLFLLVVQVVAQASGGVAMFLLGRDLLKSRWAGVAAAAVLLLNPTYQWLVWEFFHPDALAIGPLLFAYWAARQRRWRLFTIAAVVAVLCKEDVALALVVLGILIALRGDRRRGVVVALLSAAWFAVATRVLIPWQNGIGPFYDTFFGDLGSSPGEVVYNSIRHPSKSWELASADDRQSWYLRMWAPWGFLPFLAPLVLAIAGPMIFVNITTAFPYTRDFRFHYSSLVVTASAVASIEGIAWVARRAGSYFGAVRAGLLIGLLVCAGISTHAWGASPLATHYRDGIWPLQQDGRAEVKAEAIEIVPSGASLSASYSITPHMTHRVAVYEFPVPWCNINWGVEGEHLDDPATVDWIVVDRQLVTSARDRALLTDLLRSEFEIVSEHDGVVVAKRVAAPATPSDVNPAPGRCYPRPSLASFQSQ